MTIISLYPTRFHFMFHVTSFRHLVRKIINLVDVENEIFIKAQGDINESEMISHRISFLKHSHVYFNLSIK